MTPRVGQHNALEGGAAPRAALVAPLRSQPPTANRFHLATPSRQVGTAIPSRPFADQRTHLDRVPHLSLVNGGLGTTRPTLRPLHKNKEPRTKNTPSAAPLLSSCPPALVYAPCPRVPSKAPPSLLSFRDHFAQLRFHRRTPTIHRHPAGVLDVAVLRIVFEKFSFGDDEFHEHLINGALGD